MAFIITRMCRDRKDSSCVEVCPVDCIYEYTGDDPSIPKNQLLVDPDECIDCNACVPACPWEAIFSEEDLPEVFEEDIEINAKIGTTGERTIPPVREEDKPVPTAGQVKENAKKWGYE